MKGGEVIGLSGELGSGKTVFVKGLAEGLKIQEPITSPTFILLREYPSASKSKPLNLVHIDLYRIREEKEVETIGLSDYLGKPDKVCVIEWPEKAKSYLKKRRMPQIWLKFEHIGETERRIKIQNDYIN